MAASLDNGYITFGDSSTQSSAKGVSAGWGRINGTTTLSGSYNVSSVGYSGGHYYVYWATSMGSTNYMVAQGCHSSSGSQYAYVVMNNSTFTASQCDLNTNSSAGAMFAAYKA